MEADSFVKFILTILGASLNVVISIISFSDFSLRVCENIIDIFVLMSYSASFLNSDVVVALQNFFRIFYT